MYPVGISSVGFFIRLPSEIVIPNDFTICSCVTVCQVSFFIIGFLTYKAVFFIISIKPAPRSTFNETNDITIVFICSDHPEDTLLLASRYLSLGKNKLVVESAKAFSFFVNDLSRVKEHGIANLHIDIFYPFRISLLSPISKRFTKFLGENCVS